MDAAVQCGVEAMIPLRRSHLVALMLGLAGAVAAQSLRISRQDLSDSALTRILSRPIPEAKDSDWSVRLRRQVDSTCRNDRPHGHGMSPRDTLMALQDLHRRLLSLMPDSTIGVLQGRRRRRLDSLLPPLQRSLQVQVQPRVLAFVRKLSPEEAGEDSASRVRRILQELEVSLQHGIGAQRGRGDWKCLQEGSCGQDRRDSPGFGPLYGWHGKRIVPHFEVQDMARLRRTVGGATQEIWAVRGVLGPRCRRPDCLAVPSVREVAAAVRLDLVDPEVLHPLVNEDATQGVSGDRAHFRRILEARLDDFELRSQELEAFAMLADEWQADSGRTLAGDLEQIRRNPALPVAVGNHLPDTAAVLRALAVEEDRWIRRLRQMRNACPEVAWDEGPDTARTDSVVAGWIVRTVAAWRASSRVRGDAVTWDRRDDPFFPEIRIRNLPEVRRLVEIEVLTKHQAGRRLTALVGRYECGVPDL